MSDPENELFLSAVSSWEIAVKHSLGRLPLPEAHERGIDPLLLDEEAALQITRLPNLHRDPFDRMLVCQALVGGMMIVTPDPEIARYPVRTLW